MRYIIYGAGGVGGTIGARLFLSGADVMLIARGAHHQAIADEGLHFVSPGIDQKLNIPVVAHPDELDFGVGDVVFMCMKSQHTQEALEALVQCAGDQVPVVVCQNGVANETLALRYFTRVYAMLVVLPGTHLQPGLVINPAENAAGCLDAGCFPQGVDETIREICAMLQQAGFLSSPDPSIMRFKYAKLLANLMNVIDAATGQRSGEIANLLNAEALACYEAAKIEAASVRESATRFRSLGIARIEGYDASGNSTYQSLVRGTGNIEADYLNGEIAWLGRLHGVATPANIAAQRLGRRLVKDKLAPGTFSHDDVMAMLRA